MKHFLTFLLLGATLTTMAQSIVYQGFEVDSAAEPRGGMAYLSTFLQTNLRKPVAAQADGKGGRVILSAIIEPDGRPSSVKILQAFRPDCGREAVEVFSQFQAWKPAQKEGKAVRQNVTLPVMFETNPPFRYENGAKIMYFDANQNLLPDSSERARYKQVTSVDTNDTPNGNVVVYELKRKSWNEMNLLLLLRLKESWQSPAGVPVFSVGNKGADGAWQGWVHAINANGTLMRRTLYADKNKQISDFIYHPNGVVAQQTTVSDPLNSLMAWFPNGQIRQVWTDAANGSNRISHPGQLVSAWDSTGRAQVVDGNGRMTYREPSALTNQDKPVPDLIESGTYRAGVRHGSWSGQYADASYYYEDQYNDGLFVSGWAVRTGKDTVRYTVMEKQPEFRGGLPALSSYLGQNINFPSTAQRAGAAGQVLVSFVVDTDGSIDNCQVIRGIHPDADQEALRVVKAMKGRWTPGMQRGQPVRVKYNMPINFSLN